MNEETDHAAVKPTEDIYDSLDPFSATSQLSAIVNELLASLREKLAEQNASTTRYSGSLT